jgi:predicted ester cyclase
MNRMIVTAALGMLAVMAPLGRAGRTAEKNKAVVRRVFTEILSEGRFEVGAEIYAKDYVNHGTTKDIGLEESNASDHGWRAAFPDLEMTVEKEIVGGDFVTVVWRGRGTNTGSGNGLNATGKKVDGRGISIFRVVDGKIEEEWTEYSGLLILQQLGLYPARP